MLSDAVTRFLDTAARAPDAPAVVEPAAVVNYGQLADRVRRVAALVARHDNPRVLLCLPRGAQAYAAMLGVGLGGGCYTPLNTESPQAKLRRVADRLEPTLVIGDPAAVRAVYDLPADRIIGEADLAAATPLDGVGHRHDIAYILFTSGSTGIPKGVMVPRVALNHYLAWVRDALAIGPQDRVAQHGNLAFDISITDTYGGLCAGAALYPVIGGDRLMPARMIRKHQITVWNSVPSVVGLMLQARQLTADNIGSLRLVNFCGEPLPASYVEAILEQNEGARVINTYGPTEATVSVTELAVGACNLADVTEASVALGSPIPGMGLHLLGGSHPDEGELVITGPQLARGYWRDQERTTASFREVEIDGTVLRGYWTGDWVERRRGHLFFRERIDFQVKVGGFRVELDEVAHALRGLGWPVVAVFKHGEGLAAVLEAAPGKTVDPTTIQQALASSLEAYCIPAVICEIGRMPRNDNDKIDRAAAADWLAGAQLS